MNKVFYAIVALLALTSCANSYNIVGTSNVSNLDGRMLYLKILKNNEFKTLDSCDVVHGQFHFSGTIDSVRMGNIFMDEESVLPLVVESGDINIKIDNTQQIVSGTPLNDKLFQFFNKYNQLKNQESAKRRRTCDFICYRKLRQCAWSRHLLHGYHRFPIPRTDTLD